jgi:two-component system osmolarity sensor histidine kinase EnvZ
MLESSEDIEDLKSDIAEMEHMLDGYIAFAEGLGTETTEETNLGDLLEEIQIDAKRKGLDVSVHGATDLAFPLRRMSIKRCINNLVNNACTYGTHAVITAWRKPNNWVEITIDDDGHGIPEARREEAFRPFHRLDVGRNLESSGSGLGLAIARDIVRSHGGDLKLQSSPLGGLRALISIPV